MTVVTHYHNFRAKLSRVAKDIADVLVPPTCLSCDQFVAKPGGCCPQCWSQLRFVTEPLCPVLGTPFSVDMGGGILSAEAIVDPPPFDRLRTVVIYDDLPQRLVASLKYGDRTDIVPWIANWMNKAGQELIRDADVVVPIPLHRARLRSRRFNQSAELSRCIAKLNNKTYLPDLLLRKRNTRQQVGLTEGARERNVSGAFHVPEEKKAVLQGKRVLLVDDVYTTGATVKAAARALKRGKSSKIDVLVFAKVETHLV
ncbi:MAG: ComF family protein [Pseudomonadota bacterium]